MPTRSQEHLLRVGRATSGGQLPPVLQPPPITNILPDTANITAVGAVGRVVAALSVVGGTPPVVFTITSAGGLAINIVGAEIRTTADPVGPVAMTGVTVQAADLRGQIKTEAIAVTVT